jgi:hypothetical protein
MENRRFWRASEDKAFVEIIKFEQINTKKYIRKILRGKSMLGYGVEVIWNTLDDHNKTTLMWKPDEVFQSVRDI